MCETLWEHFVTRARALHRDPQPQDDVDRVILWQLNRIGPFANCVLKARCGHAGACGLDDLQLPELFSGAPWRNTESLRTSVAGRWVAFVCLNPALTCNEQYPTVGLLAAKGAAALVPFFENRFQIGQAANPELHGRPAATSAPTYYVPTNLPKTNTTWNGLEAVLRAALGVANVSIDAPLGRVGAVVDMAPSINSVRSRPR